MLRGQDSLPWRLFTQQIQRIPSYPLLPHLWRSSERTSPREKGALDGDSKGLGGNHAPTLSDFAFLQGGNYTSYHAGVCGKEQM